MASFIATVRHRKHASREQKQPRTEHEIVCMNYSCFKNVLLHFRHVEAPRPRADSVRLVDKVVAVALKHKSTPSSSSSSSSASSANLLSLPLELRDEIFSFLLADLSRAPQHPWDDLAPYQDFGAFAHYVALLLVNRQIATEVRAVYAREVLPRLTYYVDDLRSLQPIHELQRQQQRRRRHDHHQERHSDLPSPYYPLLHPSVRFHLRVRAAPHNPTGLRPSPNGLKGDLTTFYRGFLEEWDALPRPYSAVVGLRFAKSTDPAWNPLEHGFSLHPRARCCAFDETCTNYREIAYPPLEESLRLRTCTWWVEVPEPEPAAVTWAWESGTSPPAPPPKTVRAATGCFIVEGLLKDLDFDDYRHKLCQDLLGTRLPFERPDAEVVVSGGAAGAGGIVEDREYYY